MRVGTARLRGDFFEGGPIKRRKYNPALWLTLSAGTALIILWGGCTSSYLFMLPNHTQEYRIFGHHFLKVLLTNSVYDEPGRTYRMYISQEYHPPAGVGVDADTVGAIEIDSLCLQFNHPEATFCPLVQEKRLPEGPAIQDGIVVGPAFNWGILTIPDKCDTVRLSFVATLVDAGGGARSRQPVEMVLSKKKKTVGSFLR